MSSHLAPPSPTDDLDPSNAPLKSLSKAVEGDSCEFLFPELSNPKTAEALWRTRNYLLVPIATAYDLPRVTWEKAYGEMAKRCDQVRSDFFNGRYGNPVNFHTDPGKSALLAKRRGPLYHFPRIWVWNDPGIQFGGDKPVIVHEPLSEKEDEIEETDLELYRLWQ